MKVFQLRLGPIFSNVSPLPSVTGLRSWVLTPIKKKKNQSEKVSTLSSVTTLLEYRCRLSRDHLEGKHSAVCVNSHTTFFFSLVITQLEGIPELALPIDTGLIST